MGGIDEKVEFLLFKLGFEFDKIYLNSSTYQYGYIATIDNFYYTLIYKDFDNSYSMKKSSIEKKNINQYKY